MDCFSHSHCYDGKCMGVKDEAMALSVKYKTPMFVTGLYTKQ